MKTWLLSATLLRYKLEDDSDYHLVIRDGAGRTMIVELPYPGCVGSRSPFLRGIKRARRTFEGRYRVLRHFRYTHKSIQIVGVGFFDDIHGQSGVAPNGIELHPVLGLSFGRRPPAPPFR